MTASAWMMMLATWSVVIFFTARFFMKVLRQSSKHVAAEQDEKKAVPN